MILGGLRNGEGVLVVVSFVFVNNTVITHDTPTITTIISFLNTTRLYLLYYDTQQQLHYNNRKKTPLPLKGKANMLPTSPQYIVKLQHRYHQEQYRHKKINIITTITTIYICHHQHNIHTNISYLPRQPKKLNIHRYIYIYILITELTLTYKNENPQQLTGKNGRYLYL